MIFEPSLIRWPCLVVVETTNHISGGRDSASLSDFFGEGVPSWETHPLPVGLPPLLRHGKSYDLSSILCRRNMVGGITKLWRARIFRLQDILPSGGDAGSSADIFCLGLQLEVVGQRSVCHRRRVRRCLGMVVCCRLQTPRRSESMAWGSRHHILQPAPS
jgi:hypothetical protein